MIVSHSPTVSQVQLATTRTSPPTVRDLALLPLTPEQKPELPLLFVIINPMVECVPSHGCITTIDESSDIGGTDNLASF